MTTYDARYRKGLALRHMHGEVKVSSVGTVRRLEALARIGWPQRDVIRSALGYAPSWSQLRRPSILKTTADRVAAVYDALSTCPGPSSRTRTHATMRGYPPPLAWDDIDNPRERPKGVRPVTP